MMVKSGLNRIVLSAVCLCLLCAIGCGGAANGRKAVYPVTGTVKFAGAPVVRAIISFTSKEGLPAAVGRTDDNGNFVLTTYDSGDGAAVGKYAVVIMKFASPVATNNLEASHSPDGTGIDSGHNAKAPKGGDSSALLPPVYADAATTTLAAEVKAEDNKFDFTL